MNAKFGSGSLHPIPALCCSAVLLAVANGYLLLRPVPPSREVMAAAPKKNVQTPAIQVAVAKSSPATPPPAPSFAWEPIESADYKAYIENLRKLGFPEELIRELIVSDINALYASREEALRIKQVPHDAPLSQRRRPPTLEDVENQRHLLNLRIEKQEILEQLLGVRVPREILRTPNSRNYESYKYALSILPQEKREAVQRLQENVFLDDDLAQVQHNGRNVPAFRKINERFHQDLQRVLTPEEFDRYMMNTTPAGTEMARRIIGMEPNDEEQVAIWRLTHQQWKEQGGVYDWWRADPVTPEKIREADDRLAAGLRAVLGEDRYADYQMAVSETGQQLRNFAAKYDLPRETLVKAFELQNQIEAALRPVPVQDRRARMEQATKMRQELATLLGPDLHERWARGRSILSLQPDVADRVVTR
jgi:hypothetical protein